jgi:hypothetical protein
MVVKAFPVRDASSSARQPTYQRISAVEQRHGGQIRGSSNREPAIPPGVVLQGRSFAMTARKKWSAEVTENSDALHLEEHIFESDDAKKVAASLKRSAEHSDKAEPFQSAMSMLNFYINRAGGNLPEQRKRVLEKAKDELRAAFGHQKQD